MSSLSKRNSFWGRKRKIILTLSQKSSSLSISMSGKTSWGIRKPSKWNSFRPWTDFRHLMRFMRRSLKLNNRRRLNRVFLMANLKVRSSQHPIRVLHQREGILDSSLEVTSPRLSPRWWEQLVMEKLRAQVWVKPNWNCLIKGPSILQEITLILSVWEEEQRFLWIPQVVSQSQNSISVVLKIVINQAQASTKGNWVTHQEGLLDVRKDLEML